MASITIRNLDEGLKAELRLSAARHGRSMEEEVRVILRNALRQPEQKGLGSRIRERFGPEGAALDLPSRQGQPRRADFDE
uniref:FitA-like ribbon-helix-helix domain-containing protein n=1 Tax=Halomonas sp. TaxID=1486246 RepID=UPI00260B73FE|nr:plasmid stabilization protein [Halomonas sp.]